MNCPPDEYLCNQTRNIPVTVSVSFVPDDSLICGQIPLTWQYERDFTIAIGGNTCGVASNDCCAPYSDGAGPTTYLASPIGSLTITCAPGAIAGSGSNAVLSVPPCGSVIESDVIAAVLTGV